MVMEKLKNIRISVKLIAAFLCVGLIVIAVSTFSYTIMRDAANNGNDMYARVMNPITDLSRVTVVMEKVKTESGKAVIYFEEGNSDQFIKHINGFMDEIETLMLKYEDIEFPNDEIFTKYHAFFDSFEELSIFLNERFYGLISEENENVSAIYAMTLLSLADECSELLNELTSLTIDNGNSMIASLLYSTQSALNYLVLFAIVGLVATLCFGFYFAMSIIRPILKGAELMKKAADGDFSIRLPDTYGAEIGQLFSACNLLNTYNEINVATLGEVNGKMRELAHNMLDISSNMESNSTSLSEQTSMVSASAEEFSAGMTQSASSLSTASSHISAVATSIEEINSTISTVAAAAEQTSTRVEQSSSLVDNIQNSIANASGSVASVSKAFNRVASSVDEINGSILVINKHFMTVMEKMSNADEKAKNTSHIIQRLEDASKQIGKIVNVISDIADQTNMLALNAAIEAAGAGEAGRGFMIVANEVKELAKQTAEATDEIADQIENMQKNMPDAVGAVLEITAIINSITEFMKSFADEITQQGRRSDKIADESAAAAKSMSEITKEIEMISENSLSVTKAVVESTKGVNEIAKSTAELVVGTQEIAMNSERASNNIGEINRAVGEMLEVLAGISKNMQLMSNEADEVQNSAVSIRRSSEELFESASEMDKFISKFVLS